MSDCNGATGARDGWRHDFGAILVCAERYAILRSTYMPGLVADYIRDNLRHDPHRASTARCLARDIRETRRDDDVWREEHPDLAGCHCGVGDFEALLPMLDEVAKEGK